MNDNKRNRRRTYLPILMVICMIVTTIVPSGSMAFADVDLGDGATMTVKGSDDGGAYDAESGTAAKMGYSGKAAKQYTFTIQLDGLSGSGNKVSVELADGMKFASTETNAPNFSKQLTDEGIKTTNFDTITSMSNKAPYDELEYKRGEKKAEAELKSGTSAASWQFTVQLDDRLLYKDMPDAIKVTYTKGDAKETITIPVSADMPTYNDSIEERTKTVASGGSASFNFKEDSYAGLFGLVNGERFYIGNYQIIYTCPSDISMSLKDGMEDKFKLTKSGDTYTLTSLNQVGGADHYGRLEEPVVYTVAATTAEATLMVNAEKTFTTYDGKTSMTTSSSRKFIIVPDEEAVYVQHTSNTAFINRGMKTNGSISKEIKTKDSTIGSVGNIHIGNAGNSDSEPKTCEISFDKDLVHVTAVPLNLPVGNTLTKVEVKTNKKSDWTSITLPEKKTGEVSLANWVSSVELGLAEDEFITDLRYEMGSIPANSKLMFNSNHHYILGKCLFDVADGTKVVGTVEVYDTADKTKTTGKGEIKAKVTESSNLGFGEMGETKTAVCGESVKVSNVYLTSYYSDQYSDLSYYIVVPDGSTLSDLKITYGNNTVDVTQYLDVTGPLTSTDGSRYYKVETSKIPDNVNNVGAYYVNPDTGALTIGRANLSYTINTSQTETPAGEYALNDMIYVENKNVSNATTLDTNSNRTGVTGNPVGFEGVTGAMFTMNTTNTLTLNKAKDIIATSESKHEKDTDWSSYDGTDASYLGVGFTSGFQIKTNIKNTSGSEAPVGTTVWQPVPKAGEDWGNLGEAKDDEGNDLTEMPFDIELKSTIENPDAATYEISYGVDVTPPAGENYNNWDDSNGTWYTKAQIDANSDLLKKVNCIKITNIKKLAIDAEADFILNATIPAGFEKMEEHVDIFRPLIYRDFSTDDGQKISGHVIGNATAIQMCLGNIEGFLFKDANKNGKYDTGEEKIDGTANGGWTVSAYRAGTSVTALRTDKVAADGSYSLVDITRQEGQIDLIANNQLTGENYYFTKVVKSDEGNWFADSSDHKNGTAASVTAVMEPGKAETRGEGSNQKSYTGLYNAGITNAKTTLTFKTATGDNSQGTFTLGSSANQINATTAGYGYESIPAVSAQAVTGYQFVGWSEKDNADVDKASDFTSIPSQYGYRDTTYYAYFKAADVKYTVKHYKQNVADDGYTEVTADTQEKTGTTGSNANIVAKDYTGFTYKSAKTTYEDSANTTASTTKLTVAGDGSLVVKLYYDRNTNDVTYSFKGTTPSGVTAPAKSTQRYGAEVTVDTTISKGFTQGGYEFEGWKTTDVTVESGKFDMPNKNVAFEGTFKAIEYKITYKMNEGTNASENPDKYTVETDTITLKDPQRNGYTFIGWTTDGVTTPTKALTIPKGSTGDKEFTANWLKTSNINFDTNGGKPDTIDSIKADKDDNITDKIKNVKDPTRKNYDFAGWVNSETNNVLTGTDKMPDHDITLKAKWNKDTGREEGDKEIAITAIDFTVAKDKVAELNDAKVIALAEAKAWMQDDPATEVAISTVDYSKIKAESGDYPVTFTATKDGKTVHTTVTAYVRDNHGEGDQQATIAGNDIIYPIFDEDGNRNPEFTPADILKIGKVVSTDLDGFLTDGSDVTVDADQLEAINKEIRAERAGGPYDLKLSNTGGATTTIKVTLTRTGSEITDGEGQITSRDEVDYSIKNGTLTEAAIKELCEVIAKDKDGNVLSHDQVKVNAEQFAAINQAIADGVTGPLQITFSDPEGHTTTTIVNLKDNGQNDKDKGSLHSNDVTLQIKDGQRTAETMKELCQVTLYDKSGNKLDISKVTADRTELDAINDHIMAGETGTYPLTFTDPDSGLVTVSQVTLEGDPDLKITKTLVDAKDKYKKGDVLSYQIKVTNTGAAKAMHVTITDKPEGLDLKSVTEQAGVSFDQNSFTWTVDEIGPNKTVTINYQMVIRSDAKSFENTAYIGSINEKITDSDDPDNSDNGGKYQISDDGQFVRTGDDTNLLMGIWITLTALMAAIITFILGRRKKMMS